MVVILPPQPVSRPPPQRATNHLPVRFAGNHLCLSCSARCSHDKIRNSLPLFTHHRPGSTSRQSGVVARPQLTPGYALSPLIQAYPAGGPGPGHVIHSVTAAAFHATIQMSSKKLRKHFRICDNALLKKKKAFFKQYTRLHLKINLSYVSMNIWPFIISFIL